MKYYIYSSELKFFFALPSRHITLIQRSIIHENDKLFFKKPQKKVCPIVFPMIHKIIHIDMDAFYASIEQRDFPQYRDKPLVVGGDPNGRGVVATCSYEARKYGIHSAMPSYRAYRLCPQAIFVKPRFAAYKEASQKIREIFYQYTSLVEPLSLDEAYLDVTDSKKCFGSATLIAKEIKRKIFEQVQITASAGVSYNKFLAKIASDIQKPNGLTIVLPQKGEEFVKKLKIRQFYGVGKATEKKMHRLNIYTGADLKKWSITELKKHFGKFSNYLYSAARAIDNRSVKTFRQRKSVGKETTFLKDISKKEEALIVLEKLTVQILDFMQQKKFTAKTLTLKMKYTDFRSITRSQTQKEGYQNLPELLETLEVLLAKTDFGKRKIRLLGVSLTNLVDL